MSAAAAPAGSRQTVVLVVLALVNGVVALDRLAVNFLSPYIVAELGLSNAQLGLVSSALSLAIAISALVVGPLADASGRRRGILIAMLIAFSLLSAGAGLAIGFASLAMARMALGAAEGPLVPLSQSLMAAASSPERRGFNMGAMQICGAFLLGAMLGPILAVEAAERFGWRAAFFLSVGPGLLSALLVWLFVRETPQPAQERAHRPRLAELMQSRNLAVCMAIAGLFTAWLTIQNVFMPVFLTGANGFSGRTMGMILGAAGFGGLVGGVALPAISDRIGRRPVLIFACLAGVLAPAAMLVVRDAPVVLGMLLVIGWLPIGCAPLVCAIIPGESVNAVSITSAVALSMATAELVGGVLTPPLAGLAADRFGMEAPFWIAIALALGCAALALLVRETAPRLGAQSASAAA